MRQSPVARLPYTDQAYICHPAAAGTWGRRCSAGGGPKSSANVAGEGMLYMWNGERRILEHYYPTYGRAVRAAAQESTWVCWHYSAEEWWQFDRSAWQYSIRRMRSVALWGCLLVLLLGWGSFSMTQHPNPAWWEFAFVGVAVTVAIAGVQIFVREIYVGSKAAQHARHMGPREICIGPLAVVQPGQTLPLTGYSVQLPPNFWDLLKGGIDVLQNVAIQEGKPAWIVFYGRRIQARGGLGRRIMVEVPIPAGHEDEAIQLVQRFHTTILADP